MDTTVQTLLGQSEETPAELGEIAAALTRINDQLAIQNRRRSRIWRIVAWLIAVYVAFNVVLLVLGYAMTAEVDVQSETHAVEESVIVLQEGE